MNKKKAKIFAAIGEKGGGGKTTLSQNIAGVLTQSGFKVAIVDTDPQNLALKSYAIRLDYIESIEDKMKELNDARDSGNYVNERTFSIYQDKVQSLEALKKLTVHSVSLNILRKSYIDSISYDYDYIIIDTPGHFESYRKLEEVIHCSDVVLAPVANTFDDLSSVPVVCEAFSKAKAVADKKILGFVILHDLNGRRSKQDINSDIVEITNKSMPILEERIVKRVSYADAKNIGLSVIEEAKDAVAANQMIRVVELIIEKMNSEGV